MSQKNRLLLVGLLVALVAVVAAIAFGVTQARQVRHRANEAVLANNLTTLRDVIRQFHDDKGRYPGSLDELVLAGYLRQVPTDPFTRSRETWELVFEPHPTPGRPPGVIDVRSGAPGTSMAGLELGRF
jgi:general secretion pathway protein G